MQAEICTYRAQKNSVNLAKHQAGPGRKVEQEHEEISPNHVQAFLGPLYDYELIWKVFGVTYLKYLKKIHPVFWQTWSRGPWLSPSVEKEEELS